MQRLDFTGVSYLCNVLYDAVVIPVKNAGMKVEFYVNQYFLQNLLLEF